MERILIGPADDPASEIVVGRGLLAARAAAEIIGDGPPVRRVAIFTQPGEPAAIGRALRRSLDAAGVWCRVRVVPDGEAAKTLAVAGDCYEWLNDVSLDRHDLIVGVGGGAVTDLSGFVAATYLRGLDVVHVPTTLLAAVDASIGGKTGVNIDGKNLVGAFHHPLRVVIDPDVLDRLPQPLIVEGAAEALKAGLVADPELVDLYESEGIGADLERVVSRAVRVKARVVSEDFKERGRRAILNYGHTVGHAVEVAAGLPHGQAVAIGMVAAGAVSTLLAGFTESARQRALIQSLGLPVDAAGVDRDEVTRLVALDKKRRGGTLHMALLESIGRATVRDVDDATVAHALAAVGID